MYPTSILLLELGARSTSYSAASVVNGSSSNCDKCGLSGPEYDLFGTIATNPSELNWVSFHGPSTTDHNGEDTYPLRFRDWASRYLYTAAQSLTVVVQWLGPDAVRSHASGIGVTWASSLYKNQFWLYALFRFSTSVLGLVAVMLVTTVFGNPV